MPRAGNTKNVGRHFKEGGSQRVMMDGRLTKKQLENYYDLLQLLEMYEDDAIANPSPRNDKLLKLLEEVHLLVDD